MRRRPIFVVLSVFIAATAAAQRPARGRPAPAATPAPASTATSDSSWFAGLRWREIGPFRGGRVDAVVGDPRQPLVFYFGATGGGVWKTTDGGQSWRPLGDGQLSAGSVGAVAVAGADPNVVYVGTGEQTLRGNVSPGDGMFRSTDGGKTWARAGLRDAGQIARIVVDPGNAGLLYAALWQAQRSPWVFSSGGKGSGLFKSTDGGDTWTELTRNKGMPAGVIGRIGIAVAASNPDAVYALNVSLLKSIDGGRTFRPQRGTHGDFHAVWIDPGNPQRMIVGNDGGAAVSFTGGAMWTSEGNQPTAQFYHVIATTHFPYKLCGAQQDNSTVCIASRSGSGGIDETDWYPVGGGESGWIAARADDPDVVFAGSYGGHLTRFDPRTGQVRNVNAWPDNPMGHGAADLKYRFQWTFPIVLSPLNPNVLYIGAQVLFRSRTEGQTWEAISPDLTRNDTTKQRSSGGPITKDNTSIEYYGTIFTIAPSPKDSQLVWVGTDDGLVQVTRDGAKTWQNVTPPGLTAGTQVSMIEASPHDAATAYVAATRYKLDDFAPYAFVTHDYGKTWRRITAGIAPTHFVRVVREDPVRRGLLYAGTEFGVYVSLDDGASWQPLQLNLPVVPVHDPAIKDHDLVAATHGRSFGILDDISPRGQLSAGVQRGDRRLFTPGDAWRTPGGGFGGGGGGGTPGVGQNPPNGALVYVYLKQVPDTEVRLEILDARDSLVRRWRSEEHTSELQSHVNLVC